MKTLCLRTGGRVGPTVCLDAMVKRKLAASAGNGSWIVQASTSRLSHCTDSFLRLLGTSNCQFLRLYKIPCASHLHGVYLHRTIHMQIHILSLSALTFQSVCTLNTILPRWLIVISCAKYVRLWEIVMKVWTWLKCFNIRPVHGLL